MMANETARALRKRMTPQEVKLWVKLRAMKALGYHFRRQAPIDGFIVDFVCFKQRLVIEVDGGQHGRPSHQARDAARDAHLAAAGFRVIRVWNIEVDRNLIGVCDGILDAMRASGATPGSQLGDAPVG
jgi:very-short-patch-repair endonuclease